MYALFTAIPLIGHLNPLLRQAEELQRRGWRVAFAGARDVHAHAGAEAPSVPLVDLGPLGAVAERLRQAEAEASADPDFVRGTRRIVERLADLWPSMFDGVAAAIAADRPDIVVVDLFSPAGMAAAEAAGVPFVVNNPDLLGALSVRLLPPADGLPLLFSGRSIHDVTWRQRLAAPALRWIAAQLTSWTVGRRLNALRASRGLAAVDVHEMLRGRTVLVNGAFGLEYPRPLPPHVEMVGPMLPAATPPLPASLEAWLAGGPPVVYVNLGTLAMAPPSQLAKMAGAFASDRFRVLWILKAEQAALLPASPPPSVRIMGWGPPPIAVLAHPNVRAFVSHCGINSVHESLVAGTPIVGIPMLADQRDMAVRVADAGVGVWLDKRGFTAGQLRAAIDRVLTEPAFRARLPAVQAAIASAGGVRRAGDIIERAAGCARQA